MPVYMLCARHMGAQAGATRGVYVYVYGKIQVKEKTDGTASIDFKYKIVDAGEFEAEDLEQSADFNNYLGEVLQHIIEDAFDNGKAKINDRSKHTTNDNSESTLQ